MVDEFLRLKNPTVEPPAASVNDRWIKPPLGWLKINIDAMIRNEKACLAFVVRNDSGKLVLIASKLTSAGSAFDAEVVAILWAAKVAATKD